MKYHFLLTIILFVNTNLFSQKAEVPDKKPYELKTGISYLNNYVYYGRVDSTIAPYLIPSITFTHEKGFFINADFYYLTEYEYRGFDFLELNAGYEFDINKSLSAGIYGTKYIYNGGSNIISGNINTFIGSSLKYNLGQTELYISSYYFGTNGKGDVSISPGISRNFAFGKNMEWSIYPIFEVNFCTLNFYEEFSSRKAIKNLHKSSNSNLATIETITSVSDKRMKLLDFELSTPLTYENKKWEISLFPTFAVPTNPIYTNTQTIRLLTNGTTKVLSNIDSTPYSEKNLRPVFYVQLGIYLKF